MARALTEQARSSGWTTIQLQQWIDILSSQSSVHLNGTKYPLSEAQIPITCQRHHPSLLLHAPARHLPCNL